MFNLFRTEPLSQKTIKSLWKLEKIILDTLKFDEVVQKIVDSVLTELGYLNLGYRIIVLILFDQEKQILKRISLSQTEEAKKLLSTTKIPFPQMDIPLSAKENLCIKAFHDQKPYHTGYWPDILSPPFNKDDALYYQDLAEIKTSMVYPVMVKGKSLGVLIFSLIKPIEHVTEEEKDLIRSFTDVVGLAVQNAKLYTALDEKTNQLKIVIDQLNQANVKLQELDKLKDEFVSLASHELRTPMTAIKGSLSTILDGYAGEVSEKSKEFLTAAYNENDRLIRLVNNLLNISRIEAGRMTYTIIKTNLDKLIKEVAGNLQTSAKEKNLYLKYQGNEKIPHVLADEDKVKEILINIIGNAIKFTHTGGITVAVSEKDGRLIISVNDTGHGIAKEDQDLLFKKFSQVQGNYAKQAGGTGLGLYICKQMIEGMKGSIWLESVVGQGSTFYFSLPIA